ncbi:phosphotransferase enzyme family protein [Metarhizium anisopliae]
MQDASSSLSSKLFGQLCRARPEISTSETETDGTDDQAFPIVTEDQLSQAKRNFIDSLDSDAVCALASRYNNGQTCRVVKKDNGSFNVCFFVEFEQDGSQWIVRIPIEPAFDDPWDKLLSEITTLQFLERKTLIPVPHIRAYGRDAKLTESSSGPQMYLIADFIPGEPLDKKLLFQADDEARRKFYAQLIDILAELRKLEFTSIGSLMPDPNHSTHPILGPVMSMSATTLRLPALPTLETAKEYMEYQFGLVSSFFVQPVADHATEDIQAEVFALDGMKRIFDERIDSELNAGPFVLSHLDLRSRNIIVDQDLQIRGIIDWEFAATVPLQVFTPPSWITGHDSISTNKQIHAEFRSVLDEKSETNKLCKQLGKEWYGLGPYQTDVAFCVAHVLRCPTDATDIFCDFFAQKRLDKPLDDVIAEFFDRNQALASEVQRRTEQCERYTQYLKKHGLYETEEDRLLAQSKALKEKWGWS